jgi:hypothetical protein
MDLGIGAAIPQCPLSFRQKRRYSIAMKAKLLDIDAVLSNARAELSMPTPDVEKARRGVEVAEGMLLDLAEHLEGRDPLAEAKRQLVLIYLAMPDDKFTDTDAEMFSALSKERALQGEIDRARKNN